MDLLVRSNINAECLHEARKVFNAKYAEREFDANFFGIGGGIDESRETIVIINHLTLQSLFRVFGDLIQKFKITFTYMGEFSNRQLVRDVNDKLLSLKELNLHGCRDDVLKGFTNTLNSVKLLRFFTYSEKQIEFDRKLNEIFPNLNTLFIERTSHSDWTFIEGAFPNLTVFEVDFPEDDSKNIILNSDVIKFLTVNPKIKTLAFERGNLTLLKGVNDVFPQLEHLFLRYIAKKFANNQTETVHFNALKRLTFISDSGESPAKVQFNKIEKLTLYLRFRIYNNWIDFLSKQVNPSIRELELAVGIGGLSKKEFLNVPQNFASLKVAKITGLGVLLADDIVDFVGKSKNLTNLKAICKMSDDEMNRLDEILPKKWNVQYLPVGNGLVEVNLQLEY